MAPHQQDLMGSLGSLDGEGAGDHVQPYHFGWRPRASAPYPFTTRQYARLLVFRSRLHDRPGAAGEADGARWQRAAA